MIFYIKHMSKNEKGIHTKTQVISQTLGLTNKNHFLYQNMPQHIEKENYKAQVTRQTIGRVDKQIHIPYQNLFPSIE